MDMSQLHGLIGEPPRVLHAIASQRTDPSTHARVFVLCAMIRNSVPMARCAITESETSVHDAAKAMRDTLGRFGIQWDGSFRFVSEAELKQMKDAATDPGPIVAS